jgi:hypothetical protein
VYNTFPSSQRILYVNDFYKHQTDAMLKAGVDKRYTCKSYAGMFDEANEGTPIFKSAVHPAELPEGVGMVALDEECGCKTAEDDMYLRLAGQATRVLHNRPRE